MTNQPGNKKPGENIVIRLKRKEREDFLEWINAQSNLSDAIRFLIEQELSINGTRNLSEHIPAVRSENFFGIASEFRYLEAGKKTLDVSATTEKAEAESAITVSEKPDVERAVVDEGGELDSLSTEENKEDPVVLEQNSEEDHESKVPNSEDEIKNDLDEIIDRLESDSVVKNEEPKKTGKYSPELINKWL